jgi:Uma2 family endonuclease
MHMAAETKRWTLEEVHRLPDDGNKYELVRGELFVTPPPSEDHETVLARLHAVLAPYVAEHRLGQVYRPRAVMRVEGSEVEPDLMVRAERRLRAKDWDGAPTPILVVEVLSGSTRRRDHEQKRVLYRDAGVQEYWIVDPDRESIRVIRQGTDDIETVGQVVWWPSAAGVALTVNVPALFGSPT